LPEEVEHSSEDLFADRHGHAVAGVDAVVTAPHTVGGRKRHATDESATKVLGDFSDENALLSFAAESDFDCVVDLRETRLGELDIEGRSDDLGDGSGTSLVCVFPSCFVCK
jgi:hypothetical protein